MLRCLQLAKNGLGYTSPNPMVGSVIVANDKIIGEGFTSPAGGHHAEVNAIAAVADKRLLSKATLYVSLEPCNHYGKTPPCTELIIKHKIPKVVVGVKDPHNKVAGKGICRLREAGVEVAVGVLKEQCKWVNRRFFCFHLHKRPYIILKWAETIDGFISPALHSESNSVAKPVWISNAYSRQLVHKWRSEEQAILVGTNTVVADNPELTTRHWVGLNPMRIVLDRQLKLSRKYKIFDPAAPTIVFTEKDAVNENNISYKRVNFDRNFITTFNKVLYQLNIQSVIVEGGEKTLTSFIKSKCWDEARIFIGEKTFGKGIRAPEMDGEIESINAVFSDKLLIIKP